MQDKYIEKKILNWFKKRKKKINLNENFLTNNILDSFDIIDLISYLEKEYDIKFKPQDLQEENFATVKRLIYFIKKNSA